MVKITIEPTRLKKFLSQVLAYKSGAPIAESSLLVFSPKGVSVQCTLASDIILFAEYSDKFFMKFSCKSEEYFMATIRLIKDRLAYGFNGVKMSFTTDETDIYLVGEDTDDNVKEKLVVVDKNLVSPFSAQPSDLGLLPMHKKKDQKTNQPTEELELMPFLIQHLIPVNKLSSNWRPSSKAKFG